MTEPRSPVGYIRRSAADKDSPGDVSREVQEHAIFELARRHGFTEPPRLYVDWAKSADEEKAERRTEYASMLRAIEQGGVSHCFAYALDRLNRSLVMTARLAKACEEHDVQIVTAREGEVRQDTPSEWLRWTNLATFGEFELRMAKARAASAMERRRERGDRLGHPIFGTRHVKQDGRIVREPNPDQPVEPILDAYRAAGTVVGACTLLEQRGIPSPRGKVRWSTSALARVLEYHAPGLLPHRTATGRRHPARAALASLLRCPFCEAFLTPNMTRGQYYCRFGSRDRAHHPRYAVREVDVLEWIKTEAARLHIPDDLTVAQDGLEDQRKAITERQERARELYLAGEIDKTRFETERTRAQSELDTVGMREAAIAGELPRAVDWTWTPATIADVLTALWEYVELDDQLRPIRAKWTMPAWRKP